ncbi:hypothetical protein, partial [Vibrio alfacsensis]
VNGYLCFNVGFIIDIKAAFTKSFSTALVVFMTWLAKPDLRRMESMLISWSRSLKGQNSDVGVPK